MPPRRRPERRRPQRKESEQIPVPVPEPEPGTFPDIIRVVIFKDENFNGIEFEKDLSGVVKIKNVTAVKGEDYATFDQYNNEGLKPGQILTYVNDYMVANPGHAQGMLNEYLREEDVILTLKNDVPEPELATAREVEQDMEALISSLRKKYGDDRPEVIVVPASASDDSATQLQPSAPPFAEKGNNRIIDIIAPSHGLQFARKIMDLFLRAGGYNTNSAQDALALLIRIRAGLEDKLLTELRLKKEHVVLVLDLLSSGSASLKHKKRKKSRKRKRSRKKKSKNNRKTRKRKKSRKKKT